MKDSERNTKEQILTAALDMFCINGYSTVSIRDIGKAVGIKESSIYYHFKNKEDILQTLFRQAQEWTQIKKENFDNVLQGVLNIPAEAFIATGIAYLENYLLDEKIYKFIQVLTIEKQRNELAAAQYSELLFTVPLEHHKSVFSFLLEKKMIHPDNPESLAAEYQALILFVFQKYFYVSSCLGEENRTAAKVELTQYLKRFFDRCFLGDVVQ